MGLDKVVENIGQAGDLLAHRTPGEEQGQFNTLTLTIASMLMALVNSE